MRGQFVTSPGPGPSPLHGVLRREGFPRLPKEWPLSLPVGAVLDFRAFIPKNHSFSQTTSIEIVHAVLDQGDPSVEKVLPAGWRRGRGAGRETCMSQRRSLDAPGWGESSGLRSEFWSVSPLLPFRDP